MAEMTGMPPAPASTARPVYLAYMLRLWQAGDLGQTWRASLENPHTGEKLGFGGLEQLQDYLRQLTAVDGLTEPAEG